MLIHDVTDLRVRYFDTDQMGIVYYGNYARFYEIGRVETMRFIGIDYRELEDKGVGMPVYDMTTRFLRPARYDDILTVRVTVPQMPKTRMLFQYEIFNQHGQLLNTGTTTLVFVRSDSGRPCAAPPELVDVAKPFFTT